MTATSGTKRGLRITLAAALVASATNLRPVAAQTDNKQLTVEVGQCVDLPDPAQRFACFEAQVEAARNAAPAEAPAASPPAAVPAAPTSSLPAPAAATPSAPAPAAVATTTVAVPASSSRRDGEPADIIGVVTNLRETVPHAFLISLDNGQVWRQTEPQPYPLRVGDRVRIYYSRFRSYRLTNESLRGFIQVELAR